jgi:uncharacterized protein YbjT (DUF2867 family)
VAAAVLTNPRPHTSKVYTLTGGTTHSFAEVTEMLRATTGKPVKHISPPAWFAKLVLPLASGMPRWQSNMAVELMAAISRGAQETVSSDATRFLKQAPRSVAAFVQESRSAFGA